MNKTPTRYRKAKSKRKEDGYIPMSISFTPRQLARLDEIRDRLKEPNRSATVGRLIDERWETGKPLRDVRGMLEP